MRRCFPLIAFYLLAHGQRCLEARCMLQRWAAAVLQRRGCLCHDLRRCAAALLRCRRGALHVTPWRPGAPARSHPAPITPSFITPPPSLPRQPPAPMTGGAAILARLRAQRAGGAPPGPATPAAAAAAAAAKPRKAYFLYASQTGTAQEIAKGLAAGAAAKGVAAEALSMNELGWANFTPDRVPVAVVVAASTGVFVCLHVCVEGWAGGGVRACVCRGRCARS